MSNYYVYLHIKKTTGEPFYIGKGKSNRATSLHGRNKWWKNIVSKYDYDIIFLAENLTPEESIQIEIYWINRIGRRDLNKGLLVNLTDGGDGTKGKLSSQNVKMLGKNNPFFGKTHSEEVSNKIRESNKRRIYSKESQEKRIQNSMIKTSYGNVHCRGKLVLNIETGIFYVSIREASKTIDMKEDILRFHLNQNKNKVNFKFV